MEDSGNRLFVGNMPFRMSKDELYDLFAQAGAVVSVHIPTDRETGRPRGFGFVEMEDPAAIDQAVQGDLGIGNIRTFPYHDVVSIGS